MFSAVYTALPSFEHIDSILSLKPQIIGNEILIKIDTIAFKNVSFYYDQNEKIFNNMNTVFSCGEKIKIIGNPIANYRKSDLKQKILYISQDEYIINETISDYFKIMQTNLSDIEIKEKLDEWNFNEDNENILNIILKDNAKNISGGQRKKLLAIMLFVKYKEADIIIIDEIESGMDIAASELYRQKRNLLFGQCKDKIIFEISHSNNDDDFFNRVIEL